MIGVISTPQFYVSANNDHRDIEFDDRFSPTIIDILNNHNLKFMRSYRHHDTTGLENIIITKYPI